MSETTVDTSPRDIWVERVLDVAPAALRSSRSSGTGSETEPAPSSHPELDSDQQAALAALQRFESDPDSASPALRRAATALMDDYPTIHKKMTALMKELDDEDLGAIDRAAALSELGDLRKELQSLMTALRSAAS